MRKLLALAALMLIAIPASADVVWPALALEGRILTWWSIVIGLIIEFLIIRWIFSITTKRAAIATLSANAVSTILGIPLIPIWGIGIEFFPGWVLYHIANWGTFNPVSWLLTYLGASFVNTIIEAWVYRRAFKLEVRRREFWWIFIANALSVGIAFGSIFVSPPTF